MAPFSMDAPGGINSVMTSLMKPVLPVIFFMQFMYLYRWVSGLAAQPVFWFLLHSPGFFRLAALGSARLLYMASFFWLGAPPPRDLFV